MFLLCVGDLLYGPTVKSSPSEQKSGFFFFFFFFFEGGGGDRVIPQHVYLSILRKYFYNMKSMSKEVAGV